MRLLSLILLALTTTAAFADSVIIFNNSPGWGWNYGPERVEVFDNSVFDLKQKTDQARSRGGRPLEYDDEIEETPKQRKAWIKKCAPMRERSHKAFQKCYEAQKMSALPFAK